MFDTKTEALKFVNDCNDLKAYILDLVEDYEIVCRPFGARVSVWTHSTLVEHVKQLDVTFVKGRKYKKVIFKVFELIESGWDKVEVKAQLDDACEEICNG